MKHEIDSQNSTKQAAKGAIKLPATENHDTNSSFGGACTTSSCARPQYLSMEESAALVAALESDPHKSNLKDVVAIVLSTGLRSNELCSLRWEDINFTECRLSVQSKTGHTRSVPFGPNVLERLRARKDRENQSVYVLGDRPRALMRRVSGQLVMFSAIYLKSIVTIHMLRNTFMSRWVNSGGDPEVLCIIAGYRSFPSVFKRFVSDEQQPMVAAQFQNPLGSSRVSTR